MHHVPPCRASAVEWTIGAQGATQGLMISVGVASKWRCSLPARPGDEVLVGGRVAATRKHLFPLGTEEVPARTIGGGASAWALVRWENWCGRPGVVALRLTLGGVSVVRRVPGVPPVCGSNAAPSALGISTFVRR